MYWGNGVGGVINFSNTLFLLLLFYEIYPKTYPTYPNLPQNALSPYKSRLIAGVGTYPKPTPNLKIYPNYPKTTFIFTFIATP